MTGKVKWFDQKKGWGYITPESGSDVFVHFSAIQKEGYKTLSDGEQVTFETKTDEKGRLAATNVVSANAGKPAPKR